MAEDADALDRITAEWRRERPDLDPAPMGVIGRISRLAALLRPELERVFAEYGLTAADFDVLTALRRSGSPYQLTPGDLCRSTLVTTGGMTKRLDRLEAAGLIRREPDPDDRRGRLIALSDEGHELVDRTVEAHLRNEERILSDLAPPRRDELAGLLRQLLVSLEDAASSRRAAAR